MDPRFDRERFEIRRVDLLEQLTPRFAVLATHPCVVEIGMHSATAAFTPAKLGRGPEDGHAGEEGEGAIVRLDPIGELLAPLRAGK
ncbi:hypothetical protein [Bradyrhizobium sp. 141]|uniref:hypothetical protein n=1 Tax=Bradyrhizobium sp. 141 TaxID=2782617 RepID=UPI001FFAB75C|nr:hypothetical protein [Bradyrhizobium sp. 141]MCK1717585.1 hypothetical protein [Bradyrhizobium sp. 141]